MNGQVIEQHALFLGLCYRPLPEQARSRITRVIFWIDAKFNR